MVESGRSCGVSELLSAIPAPVALAHARQGEGVCQHNTRKAGELSWRHRNEEFLYRYSDVASWPVLSVRFDNLDHDQGAYRQRHESASAASNSGMKLAKPARARMDAGFRGLCRCWADMKDAVVFRGKW